MTPNLKHINKSILALLSNALPSFNYSNLIIQCCTLTVDPDYDVHIPKYQLPDKVYNNSY